NIEFLLNAQSPSGTWITNSGLFTTHLATTSLVMAYLPVALEHLGNPDVRLGQISLLEGQDGNHQVSVTVFNRGLSDIVAPVTLTFFNGKPEEGEVLGTVGVESLKSNVSQRASIQVADEALTDDVHITMTVDPSVEECQIENN